jgi:hypothetical protein
MHFALIKLVDNSKLHFRAKMAAETTKGHDLVQIITDDAEYK